MTKIEDILSEKEEIKMELPYDQSMFSSGKLYITNTRIIFMKPSFFGLMNVTRDMNYRDIANVELVSWFLFGTEVHLKLRFTNEEIAFPIVDKNTGIEIVKYIRNGIEKSYNS